MYPLIEIKTVPIEIQMKTKSASLEYTRGTAEMEISRSDNGGLDIKSRPIKLQLDTFESRSAQTAASRGAVQPVISGTQAAYSATAAYAGHGQLMMNARLGEGVPAQTAQETAAQGQEVPGGADIDWGQGDMQIRYEMDKLNFDWKIDNAEFKFTPGDIEISVEQRPSVTIKYVGGPIYVPRSADPNYQAVDVKA